jgi:hypothetical protein
MEEFLVPAGALFGGLFLGTLAFSRVGHWILGIYTAFKGTAASTKSKTASLTIAIVLASGPWVLVALALLAFYIRAQPWAVWSFSGFGLALVYFAALSIHLARKARHAA